MKKDKFLAVFVTIVFLSSISSYFAGTLATEEATHKIPPIYMKATATATIKEGMGASTTATSTALGDPVSEIVVASKTGEKYHFPWCSGAKRMKEESKITFANAELAKKAGYTPAANCKGLK